MIPANFNTACALNKHVTCLLLPLLAGMITLQEVRRGVLFPSFSTNTACE
jgi:hypothetical protein